jgi:hypothetical protein
VGPTDALERFKPAIPEMLTVYPAAAVVVNEK